MASRHFLFESLLLAQKGSSIGNHHIFRPLGAGKVDIQRHLHRNISRPYNRRQQAFDTRAVYVFQAQPIVELSVGQIGRRVIDGIGQKLPVLVNDGHACLWQVCNRRRYKVHDRHYLLLAQTAARHDLDENRSGRILGIPRKGRTLGYCQMHPRRRHHVNLVDGSCKFDLLTLLQAHALDRPARAHRNVGQYAVAIGHGLGQTLGGQGHARIIEFSSRHGKIARDRINKHICAVIAQHIQHRRLFCLGQRSEQRCPLRCLQNKIQSQAKNNK